MEIVEHDALEATTGRDKSEGKKDSAIPASFRSSPTMGAMDEIPVEEQHYIRDLAIEMISMIASEQNEAAYKKLEAEQLDDSQKTALWSILDSKTRSAIKKVGQQMKVVNG